MKRMIGIVCVFFSMQGFTQDLGHPVSLSPEQETMIERANADQEFRDPKQSPLDTTDIPGFKGLDYFPYDPAYRITARYVKVDNPFSFKMKTTTARLPEYRYVADAFFTIGSKEYKLEIYQNVDLSTRPGYEDHLFLPFGDLTNGEETCGGGRFLDLKIPEGNSIVIDFNKCYNPYCAYNHKYSCPIPPPQNRLEARIPAGVMKYH